MRKIFLGLMVLANTGHASFFDKSSELVLSGTGGIASGGSGFNSVTLNAEYLRHIYGPVQLGAELGVNYFWNDAADGAGYSLLVGPTFNLSEWDFENSLFFTARAGVAYNRDFGLSSTDPVLDFGLGHRFQMFENVVYRPQLTLTKTLRAGSDWVVGIEPIAFSIVF